MSPMVRLLLLVGGVFVGSVLARIEPEWVVHYNDPWNDHDRARDLAVDSRGNVYVTGRSSRDYLTISYSPSGVERWEDRYNGLGYGDDQPTDLAVDRRGNVYVTGYSQGRDSAGFDYATIKYDSSGVRRWIAWYSGPGNDEDRAEALAVDDSGNVYVTGMSTEPVWKQDCTTIKYDSTGALQWVARWDYGEGTALALDDAGNVYVAGSGAGPENPDWVTAKYNSAGIQQWIAYYNGTDIDLESATALAVDRNGNVYVAGGSSGYATVKYDSAGIQQWVARYPSERPVNALGIDDAGNVYITGGSGAKYTTIKYNPAGAMEWVAQNSDAEVSIAYDLKVGRSGSVYVTGGSVDSHYSWASNFLTIKYNSSGVMQWWARDVGWGDDCAVAIALDNSDGVYVTGYNEGSGSHYDYKTIKYREPAGVVEAPDPLPTPLAIAIAGPNPTAGDIVVRYTLPPGQRGTLSLHDAAGRVVESLALPASNERSPHSLLLTPHCPPGVYFIRLASGSSSAAAKLIKLD